MQRERKTENNVKERVGLTWARLLERPRKEKKEQKVCKNGHTT